MCCSPMQRDAFKIHANIKGFKRADGEENINQISFFWVFIFKRFIQPVPTN